MLVDNDKQPFSLANDGAFILAEMGSQFAYTARATVSQRAGRMAVFSGKASISVLVGKGRFELAPFSVIVLTVNNTDHFSGVCAEGTCEFYGAAGQGTVGLKTFDQATVSTTTGLHGQQQLLVAQSKISADILAGDKLLKKETCCDPIQKKRIHNVRDSIQAGKGNLGNISSSLSIPEAEPEPTTLSGIAYQQVLPAPGAAAAATRLHTAADHGYELFTLGSTNYSSPDPNHLVLGEGEMIVIAKQACEVQAGNTIFHLARYDSLSNTQERHERGQNSGEDWATKAGVSVSVNGKSAGYVEIGCERIVGTNKTNINHFVESDSIGRRRSTVLDYSIQNVMLMNCEYSLVSYCMQSPVMRLLYKSDGEARQLIERLMKVAVGLNLVTASHGNYGSGDVK